MEIRYKMAKKNVCYILKEKLQIKLKDKRSNLIVYATCFLLQLRIAFIKNCTYVGHIWELNAILVLICQNTVLDFLHVREHNDILMPTCGNIPLHLHSHVMISHCTCLDM